MSSIEVSIDLVTDEPTDLLNQRELVEIYDALKSHGAKLEPLQVEASQENAQAKSSSLDMLVGSVHIILPASAFATVIASFIKNYFEARKKRSIRIKRKDGTTIQINAYTESETQKLLQQLIGTKNKIKKPAANDER